jgi:hypothetical protein
VWQHVVVLWCPDQPNDAQEGRPSRPLLIGNEGEQRPRRAAVVIEGGVVQGVIAPRAGWPDLAARVAPALRHAANGPSGALAVTAVAIGGNGRRPPRRRAIFIVAAGGPAMARGFGFS